MINVPASGVGPSDIATTPFSATLYLANTNYFCIFVWQNSGNSRTIGNTTDNQPCILTITRIW